MRSNNYYICLTFLHSDEQSYNKIQKSNKVNELQQR
jgi:hypothetical protein